MEQKAYFIFVFKFFIFFILMNFVLLPLNVYLVFFQLNKTIIFFNSRAHHELNLKSKLSFFRQDKLYTKLKKFVYIEKFLKSLVLVIRSSELGLFTEKTRLIYSIAQPLKVTELQMFLGIVAFLIKIIFKFSKLIAPLMVLLNKTLLSNKF